METLAAGDDALVQRALWPRGGRRWGLPDHRGRLEGSAGPRAVDIASMLLGVVVEGAVHCAKQTLEGERLLDEVEGTELGRLHGGLDVAVAGDHHHLGRRTGFLQLAQ